MISSEPSSFCEHPSGVFLAGSGYFAILGFVALCLSLHGHREQLGTGILAFIIAAVLCVFYCLLRPKNKAQ